MEKPTNSQRDEYIEKTRKNYQKNLCNSIIWMCVIGLLFLIQVVLTLVMLYKRS